MTRILLALICICLVGCNTNIANQEGYDTDGKKFKDSSKRNFVCTKLPNVSDKLVVEFFKNAHRVVKYKNNNMTSNEVKEHNSLKYARTIARILSAKRKKINIDNTQAKKDIISINNQSNSYDIYNDTAIRKILNLPIHRAANVIRLLLKVDCELYK